ncbi:MAG: sigma-70 family RNA polymerase sigma factor [Polyangiaceae bacterium]
MSPTRHADSPEVLARFESELDLVDLLARQMGRMISFSVTLDDLRSFGREGLLRAAKTFDVSRGVPFRRWANLRVRGAMIDGLRQWGHLPRRMYRDLRAAEDADRVLEELDQSDSAHPAADADAADARLTQFLAGMATAMALGMVVSSAPDEPDSRDHGQTPEEIVANAEVLERIRAIVATLPEKERVLIEQHYFADMTLDDAAASIGLSKSWGSRLHARAIETIARALGAR